MTAPRTEIVWWTDEWTGQHRDETAAIVASAIDAAEDRQDYLDIVPKNPATTIIYPLDSDMHLASAAHPDGTIDLFVPQGFVTPKDGENFAHLIAAGSHELAHWSRFEKVKEKSLLERAAAEGFASHVEKATVGPFLSDEEFVEMFGQEFVPIDEEFSDHIFSMFLRDNQMLVDMGHQVPIDGQQLLKDKWFKTREWNDVPYGYKFGTLAVGTLLEDGVAFSEIVDMSAKDIMGVS